MTFEKKDVYSLLAIFALLLATAVLYYNDKYTNFEKSVTAIELILNKDIDSKELPLVYMASGRQDAIDFGSVYRFAHKADSTYTASLNGTVNPRRFRLYFNNPDRSVRLYSIKLLNDNETKDIDIGRTAVRENLKLVEKNKGYSVEVGAPKAFMEFSQDIVYASDTQRFWSFWVCLIFIAITAFAAFRAISIENIHLDTVAKFTLALLIVAVFSPPPIYNIALILTVVLNLKKVMALDVRNSKLSVVFIVFFIIYAINNILISKDGFEEMGTIEKFLPFLVLAIIVPAINDRKLLAFFPASALILGFGFIVTSLIDVLVYENVVFMSFEFFTKYLHPIYYSYLLFFSTCYVFLNFEGIKKYFLITLFFLFMVFSGSKMVLIFTLIAMFINIVKINKTGFLAIPLLMVLVVFSPLKHRFNDVLNIEDTSILKENHIDNPYDSRINGLTLRLMLWREAVATMSGAEYLTGNGVTDSDENELKSRLDALGLIEHIHYNPHNQYVDTLWKTGILGLFILLLIPGTGLYYGIKNEDILLIQFSVFMIAVMFSESIFGRVNGIYFFSLVLLMLTNSKPKYENSDTGH